jgi:hypothetical protein
MERKPATCRAWVIGVIGCLLAIGMWWIANGLDRTFQDTFDPEAPLGGPPGSALAGNTTGFAT